MLVVCPVGVVKVSSQKAFILSCKAEDSSLPLNEGVHWPLPEKSLLLLYFMYL